MQTETFNSTAAAPWESCTELETSCGWFPFHPSPVSSRWWVGPAAAGRITHSHTLHLCEGSCNRNNYKPVHPFDFNCVSSSYLTALSLCGAWIWLADPLLKGRKSEMLSVLIPSVGCRGVRTGLIRRSCMSHFIHTTEKSIAITLSVGSFRLCFKIFGEQIDF